MMSGGATLMWCLLGPGSPPDQVRGRRGHGRGVANATLPPVSSFGRGGSPVSSLFRFPRHEGDGAPRRRSRLLGRCPVLRAVRIAPESAPVARCARASRRAIAAFRLSASRRSDLAGVHSAPGGCPRTARGRGLRTTLAGAASRPAQTTPHESAPRRTGRLGI